MLIAIDPGPRESAWVRYDVRNQKPLTWSKQPNEEILRVLDAALRDDLAIEMVASYGMPVGAEVFETVLWTGRFYERHRVYGREEPTLVYRRHVKLHLCGSVRANDSNVRHALYDRYGGSRERAVGRKASPGPLYGMKADCWAALGVAITTAEGGNK